LSNGTSRCFRTFSSSDKNVPILHVGPFQGENLGDAEARPDRELEEGGIPTEATLAQMRASDPPVRYLVGTPKGRLSQLEAALLDQPWQQVRARIEVKLLPYSGDVYVLARSDRRVAKERAMRRMQLKRLWERLHRLQGMRLTRDRLLLKLGSVRCAGARAATCSART
jgi:hypothetical protein